MLNIHKCDSFFVVVVWQTPGCFGFIGKHVYKKLSTLDEFAPVSDVESACPYRLCFIRLVGLNALSWW